MSNCTRKCTIASIVSRDLVILIVELYQEVHYS